MVMMRNDEETGMNWRQNQVDYGVQSADKQWQACENYINLQFLLLLSIHQHLRRRSSLLLAKKEELNSVALALSIGTIVILVLVQQIS